MELLIFLLILLNVTYFAIKLVFKIRKYFKLEKVERCYLRNKWMLVIKKYSYGIYFWSVILALFTYNILNWKQVKDFDSLLSLNGDNLIFILLLAIISLTIMKEVRIQKGEFSLNIPRIKSDDDDLDSIGDNIIERIENDEGDHNE